MNWYIVSHLISTQTIEKSSYHIFLEEEFLLINAKSKNEAIKKATEFSLFTVSANNNDIMINEMPAKMKFEGILKCFFYSCNQFFPVSIYICF